MSHRLCKHLPGPGTDPQLSTPHSIPIRPFDTTLLGLLDSHTPSSSPECPGFILTWRQQEVHRLLAVQMPVQAQAVTCAMTSSRTGAATTSLGLGSFAVMAHRTQGNSSLGLTGALWRTPQRTNSLTEELHRAWSGQGHQASTPSVCPCPGPSTCSVT